MAEGYCKGCNGGQVSERDPATGQWTTKKCNTCNGTGKA